MMLVKDLPPAYRIVFNLHVIEAIASENRKNARDQRQEPLI